MIARTLGLTFSLMAALVLLGCGAGPEEEAPRAASDGSTSAVPGSTKSAASSGTARSLFKESTEEWNVRFAHSAGSSGDLTFPEMMGGGVAVFDADGDIDLDLYLISGAPDLGRKPTATVNRLFLQGEDGRFSDATERSGLGDWGYGTGVAIGDFDNDGHEDVFVANVGPDRLYRGLGGGRFENVTAASGVTATGAGPHDWSSSAVFCDIDRDGYLDLYVARYVVYEPEILCTDSAGRREYCGPASFEDQTDVLLRNRGDGTFEDITSRAGIDDITGAGLGVICEDMNDDGWPDIYVANDGDPNQLWMNQQDGTFIDDALIMGASVNAAGLHEAGMGVVAADFDNDTDLDLFLTHLRDETNTFYRNLGPDLGFEDQTARVGLAVASTPYTGFGNAPIDFDLDGDLDLVISNGRVLRGEKLTDEIPAPWNLYAEPNLAYLNDDGSFRLLGREAEEFTARMEVGRGLASGDLDGDGDLDIVLNSLEAPVRLYRADPPAGHWLLVDAFDPRLNRRALGARVTVTSSDRQQVRTVQSSMSYLSSCDPRAHFGFGADGAPVTVEILWPDGLEESWSDVPLDQAVVLTRGEGSP